ncbi:MAG: hypothetical protein E7A06_08785 [Clostridiales bacterium]|uniref:hypothetical protein n=1 Tax=uncultured Intestinibacter sp. TaxID=1505659 RepID=UPI002600A82D|nr:hypothetical protein [uncultured Intestinibacter sp.]MDU1203033.1 hypothetical protein [Clostridiales bacterium]
MKEYNRLLGLHLDEVKTFFDNENIEYTITEIRGRKDKEKLIIPRVIKISQKENSIELIVTYFSDSLL